MCALPTPLPCPPAPRPPQVLGQWQVKNAGLQPYHRTATDLMHRFASFEARQVRRRWAAQRG